MLEAKGEESFILGAKSLGETSWRTSLVDWPNVGTNNNLSLNKGVLDASGKFKLTSDQLEGLAVKPAQDDGSELSLRVSAIVYEKGLSDTKILTSAIQVTVNDIADGVDVKFGAPQRLRALTPATATDYFEFHAAYQGTSKNPDALTSLNTLNNYLANKGGNLNYRFQDPNAESGNDITYNSAALNRHGGFTSFKGSDYMKIVEPTVDLKNGTQGFTQHVLFETPVAVSSKQVIYQEGDSVEGNVLFMEQASGSSIYNLYYAIWKNNATNNADYSLLNLGPIYGSTVNDVYIVADTTNGVRAYRNGVAPITSSSGAFVPPTANDYKTYTPQGAYLGNINHAHGSNRGVRINITDKTAIDSTSTKHFTGSIGEVARYDTVITDKQIAEESARNRQYINAGSINYAVNQPAYLDISEFNFRDADGSETVTQVVIKGVPTASVGGGLNKGNHDNAGNWTLTRAQMSELLFTPITNSANDYTLTYSITAKELATSSESLTVFTNNLNYVTPILLDLNRDGEIAVNRKMLFDIDGDGVKEEMSAVSKDDGYLFVDLDGDGKVSHPDELIIANQTENPYDTDLEAFATLYDSNKDGVFDKNDVHFNMVKIWQDLDGDGVSDSNEVKSFADYGMISLNVTSDNNVRVLEDGTKIMGDAVVTYDDGSVGLAMDAALAAVSNIALQQVTPDISFSDEGVVIEPKLNKTQASMLDVLRLSFTKASGTLVYQNHDGELKDIPIVNHVALVSPQQFKDLTYLSSQDDSIISMTSHQLTLQDATHVLTKTPTLTGVDIAFSDDLKARTGNAYVLEVGNIQAIYRAKKDDTKELILEQLTQNLTLQGVTAGYDDGVIAIVGKKKVKFGVISTEMIYHQDTQADTAMIDVVSENIDYKTAITGKASQHDDSHDMTVIDYDEDSHRLYEMLPDKESETLWSSYNNNDELGYNALKQASALMEGTKIHIHSAPEDVDAFKAEGDHDVATPEDKGYDDGIALITFNKGDGQEVIDNFDGSQSKIAIEGYEKDNVIITKTENDIMISFSDSEDTILLRNTSLSLVAKENDNGLLTIEDIVSEEKDDIEEYLPEQQTDSSSSSSASSNKIVDIDDFTILNDSDDDDLPEDEQM